MYCGQTVRRNELAIPLDRAITTSYKLLKVTKSLQLFGRNFKCSASAYSRHLQWPIRAPNYSVQYLILALI